MIEEIYEKIDAQTLKVISTETTIKEEFLTLDDLEARKKGLLAQRQDLTDDYNIELARIDEDIVKINKWLDEASILGISSSSSSSSSSSLSSSSSSSSSESSSSSSSSSSSTIVVIVD